MKTIFITVILLINSLFLFSQELKIFNEDESHLFTSFKLGDNISLVHNGRTEILGEITKFSENSIVLKNYYSKLEDNSESEWTKEYVSKIDEISLNLNDVGVIHKFNKVRPSGTYLILAGVLACLASPAFGINYSDMSFNSTRFRNVNITGLGLIATGVTINISFKNKVYYNINGSTELDYFSGSKSRDAVFRIQ
ncbi:MAG: hypothetical protein JXR58_01995 [Bacteroidales bacterium]|nr:hypothetical protein [Bacteroidales bacterium]